MYKILFTLRRLLLGIRLKYTSDVDLELILPVLTKTATEWAEGQALHVASVGFKLPADLITVAKTVGVRHPEKIRVKIVDKIPIPDDPLLKQIALKMNVLGPNAIGLTLGYSIFLVQGFDDLRLISHECRHVQQYESYGSIPEFLATYLRQIIKYGYHAAPLEIDARAHEIAEQ